MAAHERNGPDLLRTLRPSKSCRLNVMVHMLTSHGGLQSMELERGSGLQVWRASTPANFALL